MKMKISMLSLILVLSLALAACSPTAKAPEVMEDKMEEAMEEDDEAMAEDDEMMEEKEDDAMAVSGHELEQGCAHSGPNVGTCTVALAYRLDWDVGVTTIVVGN